MSDFLNCSYNASSLWQMEDSQLLLNIKSVSVASSVMYDALVLDARLRQSLTTVRSLGRRGLHIAALDTSAGIPTFSSRWCQQAFVCPADEGAEEYLPYLQQLLESTRARVLITASDGTIAL